MLYKRLEWIQIRRSKCDDTPITCYIIAEKNEGEWTFWEQEMGDLPWRRVPTKEEGDLRKRLAIELRKQEVIPKEDIRRNYLFGHGIIGHTRPKLSKER